MDIFKISRKKHSCKIKAFGITIFERKTDKEEYFVFIKLLAGIIYSKYDILLDKLDLRIFGLLLFKTRTKNSFKIYYFLFLPIWISNVSIKFLNNFLDRVIESHKNYNSYYLFLSRSGEFFLLMHHLKELLHKNKSQNCLLIFAAKYHLNICKMFMPNIPMAYIKRVNVPMVSKGVKKLSFKYKGKNIFVPMNEKYFIDVENKINNHGAHYYECLKEHLGLSNNTNHYSISEKTQNKIKKIVDNILNNNFILISPETLSNEPMEKDFWESLCKKLKALGYEIFCNAMEFRNLISETQATFLTYEESIELSKYAVAIIGMRSGFLECLSQNNVPLFVLYTDFPKRPCFKKLPSNKVLSGYTITKLPNVNKNLIFEYDVNKYKNDEDIIPDIILKINQIETNNHKGELNGKFR